MKPGVLLSAAILFVLAPPAVPSDSAPRVGHPSVVPLQSAYGRLPLYFEPNVGQFDPRVRYVTRGGGYTLFLTDSEVVIVLSGGRREQPAAVRMKLVGARSPARWEALEKQPAISNYFLGNDPAKWHTDVPNYARVSAHGVYPGMDLVTYGNRSQLEYDLAVAPGADPGQVQLDWEGADSLRLNADGDLVLATRLGDIVQKRPRVYQEVDGKQLEVGSKYVLAGGHRVRFALERYDRRRPLTIDPIVLAYSTYLGYGGESGCGIAVDSAFSAYVVGYTDAGIPTKSPYQSTLKGNVDAFVTKFSPSGNALVYSTYLGGSGADEGFAIAVDAEGSAYVTGSTESSDFPALSAFQASYQGLNSAFVTKLAPAGNALVYSTYLGGSDQDDGLGIAVDGAGSAYVTGYATSKNFPTLSPYQATLLGSMNAFVTKLAPAGNALLYSTYLGGSLQDTAHAIAVDSAGSAYVTGNTKSPDFPTATPYQAVNKANRNNNAFVTKFTPAGDALVYSTYLGGSIQDNGIGIAVDGNHSAYVTGWTQSTDFPTQVPYQASLLGSNNAFVTELTPAGDALVYSTYLGGSSQDRGSAIAVDAEGSAYVTGFTSSTNFPTEEPYRSSLPLSPYEVAFVTKFAPGGTSLVYSTYLGGSDGDNGSAIALDFMGTAYITGYTQSTDFPTQSPYQKDLFGVDNAFVTKISPYPHASEYLLTTSASPAGAGTLTASPGSSNGYYGYDTSVQLTAVPAAGYGLVSFSGDLIGGANPQNVLMSTTRSVTATFAPIAVLSLTMSHSGNFTQGQTGVYTVTVTNAAGAPATSGTVTVTEAVPPGLRLASMTGTGWSCPGGNTCYRGDPLAADSSYLPITVTVNVAANAGPSVTNQVSASGGNSATAGASDPTTIESPCDVNRYGTTTVADVQTMINEALGLAGPGNDLNHDGIVNVVDIQLTIAAAIGVGCFGS